jgi:hypothetical protein
MSLFLRIRRSIHLSLQASVLGRLVLSATQRRVNGKIHIIAATRLTEEAFWARSALGRSLNASRNHSDLILYVAFENKRGLAEVYNPHIHAKNRNDVLLFVHDDVWLESEDWMNQIRQGLGRFDVIGVAGNRRLGPQQPAWAFRALDAQGFHWDTAFLSGQVGHGKNSGGPVTHYGFFPADCQALDGVLLAARCNLLLRGGVRFDERFKFHFYDLDFCRSATRAHLSLGTWDLPITHQSDGAFGTTEWHTGYRKYLLKWSGSDQA